MIMESFLPVWIIGAPVLAAVVDWMLTPKSTPYRDANTAAGYVHAKPAAAYR